MSQLLKGDCREQLLKLADKWPANVILDGEWVGCELTPDYWPIIEGRIQWADNEPKPLFYL